MSHSVEENNNQGNKKKINLRELLETIKVEGEVGGHEYAAGALIPKSTKEEFISPEFEINPSASIDRIIFSNLSSTIRVSLAEIKDAFLEAVQGKNKKYSHWLTYV